MTSGQIRNVQIPAEGRLDDHATTIVCLLREIAAQLAELNSTLDGFREFTSNGCIDVNARI